MTATTGVVNQTGTASLSASGDMTATRSTAVSSAFTSGLWSAATGAASGEVDISITTPPTSDLPITGYLYSTDAGTTTDTLPGGIATGLRTITTLSAGGAITSGQVFTDQIAIYAVSSAGTSLISDLKTVTAGAGGAYDPADVAEGYFEIGRAGQEQWQEVSGQTTVAGSGDPVGEIENIGTGSVNFFALATGSRGTLNTTDDVVEITQGSDTLRLQPGSVPSGITLAIYGDIASTTPNDSFRIFSVKGSGQVHDYNSPGAFTVEWNWTDNESYVNFSNGSSVDAFDFTAGWNTDPIIMTWEFADGGAFEIYQNNVLVGSGTHSGAMPGTETDLDIAIAYLFGGAVGMDIKAFAYFDEVLSSGDRADLNTYLAAL